MSGSKTVLKNAPQTVDIQRSGRIRGAILNCKGQIEKGYVEIVALLYETYINEYFLDWGFKDFTDYALQELEIRYQKAMFFVTIGEMLAKNELSIDRLNGISWCKVKEIATVLNEENKDRWLKLAEHSSCREVMDLVRKEKIRLGQLENKPRVTKLRLKMSEAEASVIMAGIDAAKRLTNSENETVALEMIISDWLEVKGAIPEKTALQDHIEYLQRVYGKYLVVKDVSKKKSEV
jgi:hypothetical protein